MVRVGGVPVEVDLRLHGGTVLHPREGVGHPVRVVAGAALLVGDAPLGEHDGLAVPDGVLLVEVVDARQRIGAVGALGGRVGEVLVAALVPVDPHPVDEGVAGVVVGRVVRRGQRLRGAVGGRPDPRDVVHRGHGGGIGPQGRQAGLLQARVDRVTVAALPDDVGPLPRLDVVRRGVPLARGGAVLLALERAPRHPGRVHLPVGAQHHRVAVVADLRGEVHQAVVHAPLRHRPEGPARERRVPGAGERLLDVRGEHPPAHHADRLAGGRLQRVEFLERPGEALPVQEPAELVEDRDRVLVGHLQERFDVPGVPAHGDAGQDLPVRRLQVGGHVSGAARAPGRRPSGSPSGSRRPSGRARAGR